MLNLTSNEVWFVTGSQHLYGPETLETVAEHAASIARALDEAAAIPVRVVVKPVLTGPDAIRQLMAEANASPACVGLIAWMHTFSPAKMWIAGLDLLRKPLLHLHTQYNREIPWVEIDMDFMNLNQAAHGDREFGFIAARMRLERKVVVGHWSDPEVQERIGAWTRAACARRDWETGRIARFGDNMREVAVTDGDKVEAQRRLGFSINGYGVGDLVAVVVDAATDAEVDDLIATYTDEYDVVPELRPGGERAARCATGRPDRDRSAAGSSPTAGSRRSRRPSRISTASRQLPGLAVQRLMRDGYGFGAEGDWKTAAMVRAMKVMSAGPRGRRLLHGGLHLPPRRRRAT